MEKEAVQAAFDKVREFLIQTKIENDKIAIAFISEQNTTKKLEDKIFGEFVYHIPSGDIYIPNIEKWFKGINYPPK